MFELNGISSLFEKQDAEFSTIPLDMIEVKIQVREVFEDEDNALADLAENIKKQGVLQPILLRPTQDGYELIAGERRLRAAKLAGLEVIPAYIREMSDEEAEYAQFSENIHRKNLTQIEEAKKLQRDLDRLGNRQAVCELHQKSYSWLVKRLSLLALPEQAKRLITENISADVETILLVKTSEELDPEAARTLVDKLKQTGGKNARKEAAAVKDVVKPPKIKNKKTEDVETLEESQDEFFDADTFEQENNVSPDVINGEQKEAKAPDFNVEDIANIMASERLRTLAKEKEGLKRDKSRIENRLVEIEDEIEKINNKR
jgi:ParB family transcriptional regulator, chromosome partitioning protein